MSRCPAKVLDQCFATEVEFAFFRGTREIAMAIQRRHKSDLIDSARFEGFVTCKGSMAFR